MGPGTTSSPSSESEGKSGCSAGHPGADHSPATTGEFGGGYLFPKCLQALVEFVLDAGALLPAALLGCGYLTLAHLCLPVSKVHVAHVGIVPDGPIGLLSA